MKTPLHIVTLSLCVLFACCVHRVEKVSQDTVEAEIPELDTATSIIDTAAVVAVDTLQADKSAEEEYPEGILPVIERDAPDYYEKLTTEGCDGFIIVDKARMKVLLYDGDGFAKRVYGMACAKNYGTKLKKADNRTPEGYFNVQGVFDSTDWLYTDDDGKTSRKKGQYGPRFIRIAPQIGIHGTCAPWTIGHRVSHGCIRITNEDIMELHELVHVGMPVIVLPGRKDRQVNREEGNDVIYFATQTKYEVKAAELKEAERIAKEREERELAGQLARQDSIDSINNMYELQMPEIEDSSRNENEEVEYEGLPEHIHEDTTE